MQWGQASVVIEILPEQNLVCVIIVRRARNEAKNPFHMMHSLFAAKHAPGPAAATATVQWPSPNTTESLLQHLGGSSTKMCTILFGILRYYCGQATSLEVQNVSFHSEVVINSVFTFSDASYYVNVILQKIKISINSIYS